MTRTIKITLMAAAAATALTGYKLASDAIGATAVQASAPFEKSYRLRRAEAVDGEAVMQALGISADSYEAAVFDRDLGAVVVTQLTFADQEGDAESSLSIGRMEMFGPDLDQIEAIKSGAMGELEEVFDRVRVYDLEASGVAQVDAEEDEEAETQPVAMRITVGGLELRKPQFAGLPAGGEDADEKKQMAAMLRGVAFDQLGIYDLDIGDVTGPSGETFDLTLGEMTIGGYSDGTLGRILMEKLDYTAVQDMDALKTALTDLGPGAAVLTDSPLASFLFPGNSRSTAESLRWDGFSVEGLLGYLERGETPPLDATDLIRIGGLEVRDQVAYVNGKTAARVGRTTMSEIPFVHFMPKSVQMQTRDAVTDFTAYVPPEQSELITLLRDQGLDDVPSTSELRYSYDPQANTISLETTGTARGLYDSRLAFDVAEFDYPALLNGDDASSEAALMGTALESFTLMIEDEALLDTIFEVYGAIAGQEPETLRQQAVGLATLGALQGGAISPRIPEYATALSTFLSEGGTLTISASPEQAVTVGEVMTAAQANPGRVLDALNLTVERSE